MTTVRVTIPATGANLGPGLDSLALALGLYDSVELTETGSGLSISCYGECGEAVPLDPENLVVRAAMAVFRRMGCAPGGLHIRLENEIPARCGLGGSAAALLGGAVAANVLLGSPLTRDQLFRLAVDLEGQPNAIAAALYGGLVASSYDGETLVYASLPVVPMHVVVVLPRIPWKSERSDLPETVSLDDAVFNTGRALLVARALGSGDYDLLSRSLTDRLHEPVRRARFPAYEKVVDTARRYGAAGVAISGSGPALIAFTEVDHEPLAHALVRVLSRAVDAPVDSWILPPDTQGISISEMAPDLLGKTQPVSPVPAGSGRAPVPPDPAPEQIAAEDQSTQKRAPGEPSGEGDSLEELVQGLEPLNNPADPSPPPADN